MDYLIRLILSFFLILFASYSSAGVTINTTKIGPNTFIPAAGQSLSWAALSAFRTVAPPVKFALTAYALWKATDGFGNLANFIPGTNNPGIITPGLEADDGYYPSDWQSPNTPPLTTGLIQVRCVHLKCSDNLADLCNQSSLDYGEFVSSSGTRLNCRSIVSPSYIYDISTVNSNTCPAGYSLTGSSCNLTSPSAAKWPSDGKSTIFQDPSSGNFTSHPRDPDILDNSNSSISGNIFKRSGQDEYGNPINEQAKSTPDGGLEIIRDSQYKNSLGNPTVQRDSFTFNSAGDLIQQTSNTFNNSYITNETSTPTQPITNTQPIQPGTANPTDCDKYPDSIGCSNYGQPTNDEQIQKKDMPSTISPFPFGSSGSCPADLNAYFLGQPLTISYSAVCQFAEGIHNVIIVLAGLLSIYIAFGFSMGAKS